MSPSQVSRQAAALTLLAKQQLHAVLLAHVKTECWRRLILSSNAGAGEGCIYGRSDSDSW